MYNIRSTNPFDSASSNDRGSRSSQSILRSSTITFAGHSRKPNEPVFDKRPKQHRDLRIRSAKSESNDDDNDMMEIKRTSSGGYSFFRKRSAAEQEKISRARANELITLYEASDVKPDDLKRKANFKGTPGASSLSAHMMTPEQAVEAYQKSQAQSVSKAETDALLTTRERKLQQQKEDLERQKAQLYSQDSDHHAGSQLSHAPLTRAHQSWPRTRAFERQISQEGGVREERSVVDDENLPAEMGMEVIPSSTGGLYAAGATVFATPSPGVYRDSNGCVYQVPNLC